MIPLEHVLPPIYRTTPQDTELQQVLMDMAAQAEADKDFALAQLLPSTASGWGLELWETAYGIPVDRTQTDQQRRDRILAKVKGTGAATPEALRGVAQSFLPYPVEVEEDHGAYRFILRYLGTVGEVPDMAGLTAAVNELKPAHLAWEVRYRKICAAPIFAAGVCRVANRMIFPQEE